MRFERARPGTRDARVSLRTLRDVLRWAVSRFEAESIAFGQGTGNARDEAAWLLLWSLHLPPDSLDDWLDCRLTRPEIDAAIDLVERRCSSRMPAAWLTGEAWLRGLCFISDERALIPRSPIAELLDPVSEDAGSDWELQWLPYAPERVLDLCTGGGSLAIFAALRFPGAEVVASDISRDALGLAAQNLERHKLSGRIRLVQADLFDGLADERFDLIICNPPYVNARSMDSLPPEFAAEPALALAGGSDGMDFIRRLIAAAPAHLGTDGVLIVEVGHEADHFEAAFPQLEFAWLAVAAGERMIAAIRRDALIAALQ